MSAPNLHTLPSEILKDILDEAFADSEIRISRHHKNGPALIQELILEYFGAFFQLVDPEPPTLPSLVKSRRRPQASSHAHFFVANALNNCCGPLAVCHRLYQESFQVFWERTTFVLEEGVTCADLCDWIPDFWKPHIARVQTEGHHLLFTELRGTLGLHGLKKLCLRDCDITQAPPVIFEISGKTSKKAEELILLCRASFLDEMAFRRRTMANLAKLAPFLDIVMSFPVAVYYTDNLGGTWSTYTETFGGWLPDINVEIHTKPPGIFLNGITHAEYKKTYVRPDDATILRSWRRTNDMRYRRGRRNGVVPLAVMGHVWA